MSVVTLNQVRYYTDQDVYHYTTDNRPLQDLTSNDILLSAGIDMLNASITAGVSEQTFNAGTDFVAGTTTSLTLASAPPNNLAVWVFFDGIYKNQSTFTLSGTTLTFGTAIPIGTNTVEVRWSNMGTGFSSVAFITVGDSNFNIPVYKDYVVNYNSPLTATRAVALPTAATTGYRVRVIRSLAATGAFEIDISYSAVTLKALTTAGSWADFIYTGNTWIQSAYGTL